MAQLMKDWLFNPYEQKFGAEIQFPSSRKLNEAGNRIYNRYPARSIFLVPRSILAHNERKEMNVLDPFMGSGTTATETVLSGNKAWGLEIDPFAKMVAEASSWIPENDEFSHIREIYDEIVANLDKCGHAPEPDLTGITRWFKNNDLESLLKLRAAIEKICPRKLKNFFLVTFADCIKPVSLMERQSLKPYISTKFPKKTKTVSESFKYSFEAHFTALCEMRGSGTSGISWINGDASDFIAPPEKMDLAITSPPYINALDYTRCVKIEASLCGLMDNKKVAEMRRREVGHEKRRGQEIAPEVSSCFHKWFEKIRSMDENRALTSRAYFNDIFKNLSCVWKALKQGGEYHIICGDNTIRGVLVPTHEIIQCLAEAAGFACFGYYKYKIRDHRTSIPRDCKENKIMYEHVLMLGKF